MKKANNSKQTQVNKKSFVIFGAIIIVWLIALTAFTVDVWNQHIWQAGVDSESIYKLMVENGEQQVKIEQLQEN